MLKVRGMSGLFPGCSARLQTASPLLLTVICCLRILLTTKVMRTLHRGLKRRMVMFTVSANVLVTLFLAVNAMTDLKSGTILPVLSAAAAGSGLIVSFLLPAVSFTRSLWGMLPGIILFLISFVLPEEIGRGDGCVLAACGTWLGIRAVMRLLFLSFALAGGVCVYLLLVKKAGKKTRIPFVPFILAGQILRLWL